jgi:hypothetical protein
MKKVFLAMALAAGALGCAEQGLPTKGAIYVLLDGIQVQSGASKEFRHVTGSSAMKEVAVTVGNQGDAKLFVQGISFQPGGNDYISLDPPFSLAEFPKEILVADMTGGSAIKFKVRYTPGTTQNTKASVLKIVTSDTDLPDGTFTITFEPEKAGCRLKVTPDNYTYVGATASSPQYQEFEICNAGNDTCVLDSLSFDQTTAEFTLTEVPKKGTKIDPEGEGLGNPCVTFTVRYAPNDTPDEIYVVIKSNDTEEPEKKVKLQGETELGEVTIAWVDPGCVDFSEQSSPGATCTKIVNVQNTGKGAVTMDKPTVVPATATAYAVEWYKGGGSQSATCGAYAGTAIATPNTVLSAGASVDVAVTYVAPGAKGQNASLVFNYRTPVLGSQQVQLCGGAPKCDFDLAPPPNGLMTFHAKEGGAQSKHFVILNKGNGALLVHGVTFEKQYPTDPDGAFSVKTAVSEVEIDPYGLLPIEIEFSTAAGFEEPILNGTVQVTYQDCLTGGEQKSAMQMLGHNNDWEGVDLPVAVADAEPSGSDFKVGESFTLDGSASTGGTFPIPQFGAYTWFVYAKPADSGVFLSVAGGNSPQVQVTPDKAGTYEFRLWVFSADTANSKYYFSPEATVTVEVKP